VQSYLIVKNEQVVQVQNREVSQVLEERQLRDRIMNYLMTDDP